MSNQHSIGKTISEIIPGFDQYKKIFEVIFVPGRPGEEFYLVIDSSGKKFEVSSQQFQRLDLVMKGPNSETSREWYRLIKR